jgi:hypothetical protein
MISRVTDFFGRVTSRTQSFKTLIHIIICERNVEKEGAKWREDIDTF